MRNQKGFTPIIVLVAVLVLAAIGGAYYLGTRSKGTNNFQSTYSNISKTSLVPSMVLQTSSENRLQNWSTYTGTGAVDNPTFSIKYPSNWIIQGYYLYPFGTPSSDNPIDATAVPRVILGSGGHGGNFKPTPKQFSAGIANYYWSNSYSYGNGAGGFASFPDDENNYIIIEVQNIPVERSQDIEKIFDEMLNTFEIKK